LASRAAGSFLPGRCLLLEVVAGASGSGESIMLWLLVLLLLLLLLLVLGRD